ncbi:MAG: biotin--[acetyl-CoA-carboxylase] ligase [Bacteroidales bacterium]|nr:biotin--[acetyl-CoA-carboxylase] ligase [Bacteroidales bacterium]
MKILKFDQLDSTNNYAKNLIKEEKAEDGQVIYAVLQNAGRGQASNVWESEAGKNLTFSLIVEPKHIEPRHQFLISQAVSVGIANYLKFIINNERIHIKWPNDIYVGTKKIAGILIENTIRNNKILFSIIGVGLNVNQTEFSKNAGRPTSLSLITKKQYDLEIMLNQLATCIENVLNDSQYDDGENCQNKYLQRLLFLNEEREYEVRGEKNIGKIIGVSEFGFLQIQTKNGAILECDIKEIVYIL